MTNSLMFFSLQSIILEGIFLLSAYPKSPYVSLDFTVSVFASCPPLAKISPNKVVNSKALIT